MPGTPTPFYGFPIPAYTDPADGPDAISDLAQAVEDTLKGGYPIPNGSLTLGDSAGSATQAMLRQYYKPSTILALSTLGLANHDRIMLALSQDGVEKTRLQVWADGSVTVLQGGGGGTSRPVPFAMWAGQYTVVVTNAGNGNLAVTFPAGRFTQPPMCSNTVVSSSNYFAYINGTATATGVTLGAKHYDNTVGTANIAVQAIAVQMTPTSGQGLMTQAIPTGIGRTLTVTCHTEGCENGETAIPLDVEDEVSVICGPCGQAITDIEGA